MVGRIIEKKYGGAKVKLYLKNKQKMKKLR